MNDSKFDESLVLLELYPLQEVAVNQSGTLPVGEPTPVWEAGSGGKFKFWNRKNDNPDLEFCP